MFLKVALCISLFTNLDSFVRTSLHGYITHPLEMFSSNYNHSHVLCFDSFQNIDVIGKYLRETLLPTCIPAHQC